MKQVNRTVDSTGHPALRLSGFCAGYTDTQVVRDVTFTLEKGQLAALLGPNGSGKSTLLKGICGLVRTEGDCLASGVRPSDMPSKVRAGAIAYLGQRGGAGFSMSLLDAVLMGFNPVLSALAQPTEPHRRQALEALERVGLRERAGEDILTLSEGQRQLVLLARALVQNTPLLLLDEPDSALDFPNRHMVYRTLRELLAAENKAALLSMHDPNFALRYCPRLMLLRSGRLFADITLADTSRIELEAALSAVYGPVTLLTHNGYYVMVQREDKEEA